MNINENHIALLSRAFENDPMFLHLFPNKKKESQSKILIRFIIKRNRLLDGLILTDNTENPSYVAIVDKPQDLRNISLTSKIRLNIEMFLLMFKLPLHVLLFSSKYQEFSFSSAPDKPHYYLTMIGVDPSMQGKGLGKKVLKEIEGIAKSSHPPYSIALDTENYENVAYYQTFGYELKDTKDINGLTIYCMTLNSI